MERPARGGNRRSPGEQKRTHARTVRLSDSELAAILSAAERARMAPSAWMGKVSVDAAEHRALPVGWLQREIVGELIRLRGELLMINNNINQVACDGDLQPVLRRFRVVLASVERATETIRRRV